MKARPILFNTDMVRAVLDGRKVQTRRVVKIEPWMIDDVDGVAWYEDQYGDHIKVSELCPYGKPGDLLWVRETWGVEKWKTKRIVFKAGDVAGNRNPVEKWKPSIHMPRLYSRITLRITDVRVDRVQEITEEEAQAEGVVGKAEAIAAGMTWYDRPKRAFMFLWNSINEKRGYSWESNPWVWVIEFEPIFKNVDEVMEAE